MSLEVRSTVDALADRLRQEIFDGKLLPGQAIPQEEIAARFGVSRSPLREALRQLEAEGTVEYRANRGAFVASLDEATVRETYGVRRILEEGAIRLVMPRIDDTTIAALRAVARDLNRERDTRTFARKHHEFHLKLYEAAGNSILAKAIHDHSLRIVRVPHAREMVEEVAAVSKEDHERLLVALEHRDEAAALEATLEHLDHMEAVIAAAVASSEA
jgi:DNA-binding GntR family transcriptional regulator